QQIGQAQVAQQVAPGHGRGVAQDPRDRRPARDLGDGDGGRGHRPAPFWSVRSWPSSSAARPVRARKTSSRLGRWRLRSSILIRALSSRRTASVSTDAPSWTGTVTRRVRLLAWGSPLFSSRRALTAVVTLRSLVTVSSSTSPPALLFSSSEVPVAITLPWS